MNDQIYSFDEVGGTSL